MTPKDLPELPEPFDHIFTLYLTGEEEDVPVFSAEQFRAGQLAAYELGARSTAAQPAGWMLVPIEPTADMRNAFHAVTDGDVTVQGAAGSRWAAMLAAAPPATAQPVEQTSAVTVLPDGSAFMTGSLPLPKDHWIFAPRCAEWDNVRDTSADTPYPILNNSHRAAVRAAMRYAIRGATMCGKEMDFDPDALVLNAAYALCGPAFGVTLPVDAPPAASGDSTPPSEPAGRTYPECSGDPSSCPENEGYGCCNRPQGDPSGALRPEPEAVGQDGSEAQCSRSGG